jgi:hypothetical protein
MQTEIICETGASGWFLRYKCTVHLLKIVCFIVILVLQLLSVNFFFKSKSDLLVATGVRPMLDLEILKGLVCSKMSLRRFNMCCY